MIPSGFYLALLDVSSEASLFLPSFLLLANQQQQQRRRLPPDPLSCEIVSQSFNWKLHLLWMTPSAIIHSCARSSYFTEASLSLLNHLRLWLTYSTCCSFRYSFWRWFRLQCYSITIYWLQRYDRIGSEHPMQSGPIWQPKKFNAAYLNVLSCCCCCCCSK